MFPLKRNKECLLVNQSNSHAFSAEFILGAQMFSVALSSLKSRFIKQSKNSIHCKCFVLAVPADVTIGRQPHSHAIIVRFQIMCGYNDRVPLKQMRNARGGQCAKEHVFYGCVQSVQQMVAGPFRRLQTAVKKKMEKNSSNRQHQTHLL